ncbi:uncharacterized protein RJT20DRAFT_97590 [Scheffersomyces xylosifermentans]|uniref:uncharacterized protein n=1 Tax=Scheffersomyces xylosifermentans TaxID=1304137 RepID=UPI00315D33C5
MIQFISAFSVATSYVVAIYWIQPQNIQGKDRNDPDVIRFRFKRISLLCAALLIMVPFAKSSPYLETVKSFGILPGFTQSTGIVNDVINVMKSLLLISTLYMGPLYLYFSEPFSIAYDWVENFTTIEGVRDHVFAPVTEELIYRGIISAITNAWYTPYLFGIAHLHHAYRLLTTTKISIGIIAFNTVFQFAYTSIFGVLANHVYLKYERNLWCPIIIHCMCNLIGFPTIVVDSGATSVHAAVYYTLILAGSIGFYMLL